MSEDNWKHRSVGMKCGTCMWYVMKKGGVYAVRSLESMEEVPSLSKPAIGRCRKHSPTLNGWPTIFFTDWCGDHKLDEEKV